MKIRKAIVVIIGAIACQTVVVQAQDVFRARFRATCRPSDDSSNRDSHRMNQRDLIEQCEGTGFSRRELDRNFALVYNPTADSLQVVNESDGSVVCDVFQFQGGTNVIGGDQLERFVFVFAPNQPEAIGSAIITERPVDDNSESNGVTRARITGKIQFTMIELTNGDTNTTGDTTGTIPTDNSQTNNSTVDSNSSTNIASDTSTNSGDNSAGDLSGNFVQAAAVAAITSNVQICSGTFTAGRLFVAGTDTTTAAERRAARRAAKEAKQDSTATPEDNTSSDQTSDDSTTSTNITTVGGTTTVSTNGTLVIGNNGTMINTNIITINTNGTGGIIIPPIP
jgi:hypothetical protein